MRIWLIQTGEPLPLEPNVRLMRTALLAGKLSDSGHSVIWWTSAFDHLRKKWVMNNSEEIRLRENLTLKAIKGIGYKTNVSLSRFIDHRLVARGFTKEAGTMDSPDVIMASLPPHDIAYEAVMYAKKKHIPVIVDIRDLWPDIFLDHLPRIMRTPARLLFYNEFRMLRETLKHADSLVAVTKRFLEWGLKNAGRDKCETDRVLHLGYKRPVENTTSGIRQEILKIGETLLNKFVVFFVGTISRGYHDPSILLDVADKLKSNKDMHFVISGDGELLGELKKKSAGAQNVSITGWLNQSEITYFLNLSKLGVCPSTEYVDYPTNKMFSYLSAGLPVITGFHGEIKDIIEKNRAGFYYEPNNLSELADLINKLYNDTALYKEMSKNALRVFEEFFDADKIYDDYVEHIELCLKKGKK